MKKSSTHTKQKPRSLTPNHLYRQLRKQNAKQAGEVKHKHK
jgi:hypothetical protein